MGVLLRLAGYTLRYKPQLVFVYICLTGSTLLSLAIPRFLGITIDTALEGGGTRILVVLALSVLGISVLRGALGYVQSYLSEYISQKVAYDIRHSLLAHLQALSFGFHDRQRTGDLMSRATADVESVRWFVSFGLIYSLHILVLIGGAAGLMLSINLTLSLVALAAVPIAVYIAIRMSGRFRELWMGVQVETGRMTTILQENLSGMRVVKTFGSEEHEKDKFREAASVVTEETFTVNRLHAANSSLLSTLFALATALIVWYGGWQVVNSGMTPGELTQFVLYLSLLVFPVRMSGWVVNTFSRSISAGERIFQILDAVSPVEERQEVTDLGRARGRVKFEGVSFRYDRSTPPQTTASRDTDRGVDHSPLALGGGGLNRGTLRDIDLEVSPGQKIAILGTPGSGKSTLVSLIPRFYDVTQGRITIDGVDVRDVTLESLRRNVGIVLQDVFLFIASVRENISYGVAEASLEEVSAAARSVNLHDFIMGLPDGYDTLVGERGVTLSGGQKQRMAIARTLLQDPSILVLDDSTSSVDAQTESLIQLALDEVMKDRTTFIIANRVSSLKRADLILVMQDGEIVESGTHEELIARDGLYSEIYRLQLFAEDDVLMETSPEDN